MTDPAVIQPYDPDARLRNEIVQQFIVERTSVRLTDMELRVLKLMAEGKVAAKDAAAACGHAPGTQVSTRKKLYAKLNVSGIDEIMAGLLHTALRRLTTAPAP